MPKRPHVKRDVFPMDRETAVMARANRAVFLDRDGVINRAVMRDGRPDSPPSLQGSDAKA
jgi:hypothetical protein